MPGTAAAAITALANGPLIARAQAIFTLGNQPITKTVTIRADDPTIEVTLNLAALSETTAIVQTPTIISATTRTDDVGVMAFEHPVDNRPIISGDITYRREIFYPIMAWGDVSNHDEEGVTDRAYHVLHYAYVPHGGKVLVSNLSQRASEFKQPFIPVWRNANDISVRLPFCGLISASAPSATCNDSEP